MLVTRGLKSVAILALLYHLVGITFAGLIPRRSALSRAWLPYFEPYLRKTGNMNDWTMFIDRPRFRSFDVELVAEGVDGTRYRFGPLLPGLRKYDASPRALKLLMNFSKQRFKRARDLYLDEASRTIEREHSIEVKRVWLDYTEQTLNELDIIRKTGVVTHRRSYQRGR